MIAFKHEFDKLTEKYHMAVNHAHFCEQGCWGRSAGLIEAAGRQLVHDVNMLILDTQARHTGEADRKRFDDLMYILTAGNPKSSACEDAEDLGVSVEGSTIHTHGKTTRSIDQP